MDDKKMILSFVGLPASGKGTQINRIAKDFNLEVISIGDLVREKIENGEKNDPTIVEMKDHYNQGIPQKDSTVFDLIKRKLSDIKHGVIFDNFPFSERQLEFLRDFTQEGNWSHPVLIWIKIRPETSISRILSRKVCPSCERVYKEPDLKVCPKCGAELEVRKDDHRKIVETRIEHYQPRIRRLVEHFKEHNRVIEVDGEPTIEEVYEEIKNSL